MSSSKKLPLTARISHWRARLASFSVGDLFSQKSEPGPARTVFIHQKLPGSYYDHKGKLRKELLFNPNQVVTSKYTIITFIPRNLLEQFRRIANVYFLALCILQFFPMFTTVAPGVVILPLLFIVAATALKDGYEDYQRHQADQKVNYSKARVLSGFSDSSRMKPKSKTFMRKIMPARLTKQRSVELSAVASNDAHDDDPSQWRETLWEDISVGDFVKIADNEPIPADILICATSEEDNVAFVETKNLDGETNLKSRRAIDCLTRFNGSRACMDPQNAFQVRCDRPDVDMYRLNAVVDISGQESAVDASMVLLRGTVLRNTSWVIGVVLFTGVDTKIMLNAGETPSKRSKVERQMNPQVVINLAILFALAVVCGIADSLLQQHYYPLGAPWLFGASLPDNNPKINGLITWAFALLTFQDIVPISLYISIEVVRTLQAAFIYFDYDIWYRKTNQATIARSWNLSDDLGQIEYIFSDKTGTLTQNQMIFRQCSIGGVAYRGDTEEDGPSADGKMLIEEKDDASVAILEEPLLDKESKSVRVALVASSSQTELTPVDLTDNQHKSNSSCSGSSSRSEHRDPDRFYDYQLQYDLEAALSAAEGSPNASHARNLNGFFTVLSLCHTVLAAVDPNTREVSYKAQSPDEAALVQAAADVGYKFMGRDKETLFLKTPASPEVERYELLNILEFTSARKRMSVVVRKLDDNQQDQRPILLVKGADNVIFERLRPGKDALKEETEHHLSEFANSGLRTLTLAYKVIPEEEYQAWCNRYHQATLAMHDREARIEEVCDELERDLRLLGATAIEDRLQDGVPETIADLKKAGIKIWVATGDKMETAIAIGRSTNLVNPDSNIIIIRGSSRRSVYDQMISSFEQFFPEEEMIENKPRPSMSSRHSRFDLSERPILPLRRVNTGVTSIVGAENGERPGGFVLVVDGSALLEAFATDENKGLLLKLSQLCEGVICCRVSPLQKALIVNLVKEGIGAMTLAIGDGANDVSMIQAADVGIGISGEEGVQAVNSSDYAIAQFRFLKKLLLVHGHWSYARNGTMIANFFYKNIIAVGVKFWFQIYCGWSAAFVYDYIYVLFWNSIWTIAPVVGIGLFDRIMDYHILMDVPELYHYGREGHWFTLRSFFVYLFDGVLQSVIIYFLIHFTYVNTTTRDDGYDIRQVEFSTTMAIVNVMVANFFVGMNATAWTWWLVFAVMLGNVAVWLFTIVYSVISPEFAVTQLYGNMNVLFTSATFWLCLPITIALPLLPRYLAKAWKFSITPGDIEVLLTAQSQNPHQDWKRYSGKQESELAQLKSHAQHDVSRSASRTSFYGRPSMDIRMASGSRTDMATGLVSVDRGFDFATEEGGVHLQRIQTNISERRFGSQVAVGSPPESPPGHKGKGTFRRVFTLGRGKVKEPSLGTIFSPTKGSEPPRSPSPPNPS
ncbi:phospholipid-translocating ATPase [Coprinopsis cinerea AmutBmut pab1-1]|nr:phospholipid-translocating ATPase [Coprinopsis cinerea AmutBmut pab1-1]